MIRTMLTGLAILLVAAPAHAEPLEGDYLYRVETVRAAPGDLAVLLNWAADAKAAGYFQDAYGADPLIMRHSQGDQWDLMVFLPMESWTAFYSKAEEKKRAAAREKHGAIASVAIRHDCVRGRSFCVWSAVRHRKSRF